MKYILIIFFFGQISTGGAGGVAMQEFNSKESCEYAKQIIFKKVSTFNRWSDRNGDLVECVKK